MLSDLENFFISQPEPRRSVYMHLRTHIPTLSSGITPEWKYRLPFFYLNGRMLCYLWYDKKTNDPYIGICDGYLMDHPALEMQDRKRIKILRLDPNKDLNMNLIDEVLLLAIQTTANRR
jgi:hypothetical protein